MTDKHWLWILGFSALWLAPLLLPAATLHRYALEEMRVLAVGLLIGYFLAREEKTTNGKSMQ